MNGGLGMRYWWPWHPILAAFLVMLLVPFLVAFYVVKVAVIVARASFRRWLRWRRRRAGAP